MGKDCFSIALGSDFLINSDIPKIFLNTLGKSDLEHAHIFACIAEAQRAMGLRRTTVIVTRDRVQEKRAELPCS
jgi:hypothetical protein